MFNLELFLSAFAILFVIIDPPGCAPIFATLTQGTSRKHQMVMAFKSVIVAAAILIVFAFFGDNILHALHIDFDALRIAGGIMLFIIALQMVFEKRTENRENRAEDYLEEITDPEDISVFPMGIPMIAGPGSIASLLLLMSESPTIGDQASILAALGAVLVLTLVAFLLAGLLMKLLGKTIMNVLTRVLGFLLAALAAQFVIDGVTGVIDGILT
ncbi:MAG: MarC family protein [Acidimicrobiales bacterium]|nr:MarC family protein [Hyphomonadaceae bacterium]RZV42454.1 MAG: MarC family protein [Acidimicrobiales bacterium]